MVGTAESICTAAIAVAVLAQSKRRKCFFFFSNRITSVFYFQD
jgi:hypothetical protein